MFFIQDDDSKLTNYGAPLRRITRLESIILRKTVEMALDNNIPDGKKYIKDLIETVAAQTKCEIVSTDILYLFDRVFESRGDDPQFGGMWIFTKAGNGAFAVNHWDWVGGKGFAEIHFGFSDNVPYGTDKLSEQEQMIPRYKSVMGYLSSPEKGGMFTIHELVHVAVRGYIGNTNERAGTDAHYAYAVAALAGEKEPIFIETEVPLHHEFTIAGINSLPAHIFVTRNISTAASAYWGQRLNQACKYRSHITNTLTSFKLYKEENR